MNSIDEFIKPVSLFLKAQEVKESSEKVFVITENADLVHNDKFDKDRLHVKGTFDGEEKTLDCGKNNARKLVELLGNNTQEWVGREIVLDLMPVSTKDGIKDSIIPKSVKGA